MVDHIATIRILYFADRVVYLPNAYYHYSIDNSSSIMNNLDKYGFREIQLFMKLIDNFMSDNNCVLFEEDIFRQRVHCKLTWVRAQRAERQKECLTCFPEVDEHILKSKEF